MPILSDSAKNIVTEVSGSRSLFNPTSTLDNRKRHFCSNSQPMPATASTTSTPMSASMSTPRYTGSVPSFSIKSINQHQQQQQQQRHHPLQNRDNDDDKNVINNDLRSDKDVKNILDVKGDPNSLFLIRKVQPPAPPKITTFVNGSGVTSKKKSHHQQVASDDDTLGTLPSPATSVLDFPASNNSIHSAHYIRNIIQSKFVPKELNSSALEKLVNENNNHNRNNNNNDNDNDNNSQQLQQEQQQNQKSREMADLIASNLGSENSEIIGHYAVLKTIGTGAFSKVKLALNLNTGEKVAIKMISTRGIQDSDRLRTGVWREVKLLQFIDHPNIVSLIDTIETTKHLCLILEYVPGGELFDFVNDHFDKLTEDIAKDIFLQLVNIITYLHGVNIVHRDLKLENILLESPYPTSSSSSSSSSQLSNSTSLSDSWKPIIKLTDFGLAKFIDKNSPLSTTRCGSEEYAAPELIQVQPYDGRKTDIWSLGIILYTLLMGFLPFNQVSGQSRKQFLSKIVRADFSFPKSSKVSEEAKDLVKKILMTVPSKRPSLDEIKRHPWLNSVTCETLDKSA